jgi:ATP-dependent exoDNAse (exonuclease V) alpha subunit
MAIFRLQITPIARGGDGGHSSVGAAAYRAGERIRDDRTNEVHNHSRRKDVTHSEIMLPGHLSGQNMDWARNRASLWNSVENAETRKNARVATEIQVTLPFELPPARRLEMARTFSQEVADHYRVAVDLAVHDPRPSGDPRNFHAHLLLTTREVSPAGLGAKAGLNMQTSERVRLGLPNISQEFTAIRERWATLTNEALKEANIEARVDHRSLAEQGIDREPGPHIPFAAFKIERAGKHSEVAEAIRADYNARVQARLDRAAENTGTRNLEDVRREARENWLRMRAEKGGKTTSTPTDAHMRAAAQASGPASSNSTARTHTPAPDDDYQP